MEFPIQMYDRREYNLHKNDIDNVQMFLIMVNLLMVQKLMN